MKLTTPNLLGGVSQDSVEQRQLNQMSEQINFLSDPIEDLKPRYPWMVHGRGNGNYGSTTKVKVHSITTSDGIDHIIAIREDGNIEAWNAQTGANETFIGAGPGGYTDAVDLNSIKLTNISDSFVLANSEVSPTYTTDTITTDQGRIVTIDAAFDDTLYSLTIDDTKISRHAVITDSTATIANGLALLWNGYVEYEVNAPGNTGDTAQITYDGNVVGNITNESGDLRFDLAEKIIRAVNESDFDAPRLVSHRMYNNAQNERGTFRIGPAEVTSGNGFNPALLAITPSGAMTFNTTLPVITWPTTPIKVLGSQIRIPNGWETSSEDGAGDTAITVVADSVGNITELPEKAWTDRLIEIEAVGEDNATWYIFEADELTTVFSKGKWVETGENGQTYEITASTMPQLAEWSGSFWGLNNITWADGLTNVRVPEFLEEEFPIQDVDFYRGRLCFLAGNALVTSRSGDDLFNFFRESTLTQKETDPIEIIASDANTGQLLWFQQLNADLLLWGRNGLAVVSGQRVFSPQQISVGGVGTLPLKESIKPQTMGNFSLFAVRGDNGTEIHSLVPGQAGYEPSRVMEQAPTYFPVDVSGMKCNPLKGWTILTNDSQMTYGHYLSRQHQISSVFSLDNADAIYDGAWIGDTYYTVVHKYYNGVANNMHLVSLDFGNFIVDPGATNGDDPLKYRNRIDYPLIVPPGNTTAYTAFYNQRTNAVVRDGYETIVSGATLSAGTTQIALSGSYLRNAAEEDLIAVCVKEGATSEILLGEVMNVLSWDGATIVLEGEQGDAIIAIGLTYECDATLTSPYLKDKNGIPLQGGRTTVRRAELSFRDAGSYNVHLDFPCGDSTVKPWEHPWPCDGDDVIAVGEGLHTVGIRRRPDQFEMRLHVESPLPASYKRVEWDLKYTDRRR